MQDGGKGIQKKEAAPSWFDNFQCVGRQGYLSVLFHRTRWCQDFQVTSLWGIAGLGKSSLAKCVYNSKMIGDWRRGWVTVSRPFNLRELSQSLLLDLLDDEFVQPGHVFGIKEPVQQCRELIEEYDCFIVIDGLQSTEEWDLISDALALGGRTRSNITGHSRKTRNNIIVITNEEHVAKHCATNSYQVLNIQGLEDHEAFDLFKQVCSK